MTLARHRKSTPALPRPAQPAPHSPFAALPEFAQAEASRRMGVIRPALARIEQGVSARAAALWLASSAQGMPSAQTLAGWIRDYLAGGLMALAPQYKGRQRQVRGWEARALELYNVPNKPMFATVAYWLLQEGYKNVNQKAVTRYLKALPAHLGEGSPQRQGGHYYTQNVKPYVIRDSSVLPVGLIYEADGHCCDVYVAHPATGRPFRPELTVWIDVRSQYVAGWWLSEAESAHTTLFSLSDALVRHDHVPAFVHTDPGSGFKNRMISDEVTGFLARLSIQPMLALPGNAKGKGLTEGWFRWFEERLGKRFETFCGHNRTDDFLRALTQKVKRGDIRLPSLAEYIDAVRAHMHDYNHHPKQTLDGAAPADLWAQLERSPLHASADVLLRPRTPRTVRRWGVKLDSRHYRAAELRAYEGREVIVEYSVHADDRVWIYDDKGRQVAIAYLVEKTAWLPASRIEEAQQRRLAGQQKRLQAHLDEAQARAHVPVSAADVLDALEFAEPSSLTPRHSGESQNPAPASSASSRALNCALDTGFRRYDGVGGADALAQGHSVALPAPPPAVPAARGQADAAELAAVRQTMREQAAEAAATQTPEQRYSRWLTLRAPSAELTPEQADWCAHYAQSAECAAFVEIHEAFGYVPGVVHPHQEKSP